MKKSQEYVDLAMRSLDHGGGVLVTNSEVLQRLSHMNQSLADIMQSPRRKNEHREFQIYMHERLSRVTTLQCNNSDGPLLHYFSAKLFPNLVELSADKCPLSTIDGFYELKDSLESLTVTNSGIPELRKVFAPADSDLSELQPLVLVSESKATVPEKLIWGNLMNISLINCGISRIDESFHLFPSLVHLDLSNNQIFEICHLHDCYSLRYLDLSGNQITSLTDLDCVLGNVAELILRRNGLKVLAGIEKVYSLQKLDLAENALKDFGEIKHLVKLPCLESLNLESNMICEHPDFRMIVFSIFVFEGNLMDSDREIPILNGIEIATKELELLKGVMFRAPENDQKELSRKNRELSGSAVDRKDVSIAATSTASTQPNVVKEDGEAPPLDPLDASSFLSHNARRSVVSQDYIVGTDKLPTFAFHLEAFERCNPFLLLLWQNKRSLGTHRRRAIEVSDIQDYELRPELETKDLPSIEYVKAVLKAKQIERERDRLAKEMLRAEQKREAAALAAIAAAQKLEAAKEQQSLSMRDNDKVTSPDDDGTAVSRGNDMETKVDTSVFNSLFVKKSTLDPYLDDVHMSIDERMSLYVPNGSLTDRGHDTELADQFDDYSHLRQEDDVEVDFNDIYDADHAIEENVADSYKVRALTLGAWPSNTNSNNSSNTNSNNNIVVGNASANHSSNAIPTAVASVNTSNGTSLMGALSKSMNIFGSTNEDTSLSVPTTTTTTATAATTATTNTLINIAETVEAKDITQGGIIRIKVGKPSLSSSNLHTMENNSTNSTGLVNPDATNVEEITDREGSIPHDRDSIGNDLESLRDTMSGRGSASLPSNSLGNRPSDTMMTSPMEPRNSSSLSYYFSRASEDACRYVGEEDFKELSVRENLELYLREQVFNRSRPSGSRPYLRWAYASGSGGSSGGSAKVHVSGKRGEFVDVQSESETLISLYTEKIIVVHRNLPNATDGTDNTTTESIEPPVELECSLVLTDCRLYILQMSSLPRDILFQDAPAPQIIACHELFALRSITVFFGFQRCILTCAETINRTLDENYFSLLSDVTNPALDDVQYVIMARDKSRSYAIATRIPQVANGIRVGMNRGLSNVKIRNKDSQLLDQVTRQLHNKGIETDVVMYQMLYVLVNVKGGIVSTNANNNIHNTNNNKAPMNMSSSLLGTASSLLTGDNGNSTIDTEMALPKSLVLTPQCLLLCDEDLASNDVKLYNCEIAYFKDVWKIQAEDSPLCMTIIFKSSTMFATKRKWKLKADKKSAIVKLNEECRKLCTENGNKDI